MDIRLEVQGVPELKVKFLLLQDSVRNHAVVGMQRGAMVVQTEAKTILTDVEWQVPTTIKRGARAGQERKYPLIRGRKNKGSKWRQYYPPGSMVKGHVDEGILRRSIKIKVGWDGIYNLIGAIGTDTPYAPYVEAMPDGGFLKKALVNKGDQAKKWVYDYIARVIQAAARGMIPPSPGATGIGIGENE